MDSMIKAEDALKLFCQEFGVPKKLTFDSSKEQACKGTTFMKEVHRQDIDCHMSEKEPNNHNPVEGFIREVKRKWYRNMVNKMVTRQILDYGVSWI